MSLAPIHHLPPTEHTVEVPPGGLRSNYWYQVRVAFNASNPVHRALFYAGLGAKGKAPGNYAYLTSGGYEDNHEFRNGIDVHYLAVEKVLGPLDDMAAPELPPSLTGPDECKECGSTSLTWQTHNRVHLGCQVQDGRLKTSEVQCLFVLGCDHCSETLKVLSADEVAGEMTVATSAD